MATQHDRNESIQRGGDPNSGSSFHPIANDADNDDPPATDRVLGGGRNDLGDDRTPSDRAIMDRIVRETGGQDADRPVDDGGDDAPASGGAVSSGGAAGEDGAAGGDAGGAD